jgi:multidrug efflux pump subunit AcrB
MTFERFVGHHARSLVLIALAFVIAGVTASFSLPVGLFPQTSFPRIVVDLDSGSRPADQTVFAVTRPIEEAVRTVPGVQDVRSSTSRGTAQISIDFGWGRDMVASTLLVSAAVNQVVPSLPPGTTYRVRRMDPTVFPIISYAMTSNGQTSQIALRDLVRYQIIPQLSSIAGLARVDLQGGETEEIEVLTSPERLASYGLSMTDLANTLAGANVLQAVGQLQDRSKLYLVLASHHVDGAASVSEDVVRADARGIVRVRDVATVKQGVVPQWMKVEADGKEAVLFNIYEQPEGNAVQIARDVKQALAGFPLPKGVHLSNWYDQSQLVTQSAASVRDAILIGLGLAAGVLLLFLRSWRVTLVAMVVVPATIAATILVLQLFSMSFNIMTLGGIAAAVGLLIDDVIVMIEHIARRAAEADAGARGDDLALRAGREFLSPLSGSSLATLIVFVPLAFLSGVTGAFAKALSITMGAALALSFFMTAFVVPILVRQFVDFRKWHDPATGRTGWLDKVHDKLLVKVVQQPWILAACLVPIAIVSGFAFQAVPTGFMPAVDEGGFIMDYYTKPGTSLIETSREMAEVDEIIKAIPEVDTFSRRLGTGLGGDLGESYHGDYFIRLKTNHARSTPEVMSYVLKAVQAKVPGVTVELAQLMEDLIGDLTAVPQPIEIKLFGPDPSKLLATAPTVAAEIAKINGVVEVKSGVKLAGDAIDLQIDPVKAGLEGVTANDIATAVQTALTGVVASQIPVTTKVIGVRVRLTNALALRQEDLARLPMRAADGHTFPLSRLAALVPVTGQPEISRENLQPMVAVTGRIEGRGLGAAVADVRQTLGTLNLARDGIRYELGGLYAQQQIAFAGLIKVFCAALVAELILLLFLYEQIMLPLIIVGCSLLSTMAVFIALWLTNVDLNITALMGMTMIIGIGTEMSIFLVSEYVTLVRTMPAAEALLEASRNRLRPITMTTLAAILTLIPLALAIGQGSAIQQPLAIAIIAGLVLQYPFVLLGMPAIINLTRRLGQTA